MRVVQSDTASNLLYLLLLVFQYQRLFLPAYEQTHLCLQQPAVVAYCVVAAYSAFLTQERLWLSNGDSDAATFLASITSTTSCFLCKYWRDQAK